MRDTRLSLGSLHKHCLFFPSGKFLILFYLALSTNLADKIVSSRRNEDLSQKERERRFIKPLSVMQ